MQLSNGGFGHFPLLDLEAQLPIGLLQFARSCFNAVFKGAFDTFPTGHVEGHPIKRYRLVVLEIGLPARRDPALHSVSSSNHPVLDIVQTVALRVGASLDSC